jgi:hypothetical protein
VDVLNNARIAESVEFIVDGGPSRCLEEEEVRAECADASHNRSEERMHFLSRFKQDAKSKWRAETEAEEDASDERRKVSVTIQIFDEGMENSELKEHGSNAE